MIFDVPCSGLPPTFCPHRLLYSTCSGSVSLWGCCRQGNRALPLTFPPPNQATDQNCGRYYPCDNHWLQYPFLSGRTRKRIASRYTHTPWTSIPLPLSCLQLTFPYHTPMTFILTRAHVTTLYLDKPARARWHTVARNATPRPRNHTS